MKKVLIITYYWPPAGGPGVQRVVRFVQHLPDFGWQPVVLTVADGDYPAIDESLAEKIPAVCRVYPTPVLEPYQLYRKLSGKRREDQLPTFILSKKERESITERLARWIRGNVFLPDARVGWIPYAVKTGKKVIREEKIDLIFATSPPHTVQLIAKKLAQTSGLPWVADFRDPWTEAFWAEEIPQTRLAKRFDQHLEMSVLRRLSVLTTVSEGLGKMFAQKVPSLHYKVIHNGFDLLPAEPVCAEKFIILHFGHVNKSQDLSTFFQALETLPQTMREQTKLIFVGRIFEGFRELFAKYEGIFDIEMRDYMPLQELMVFARQASLLLRPMIRTSYAKDVVGAKTFDYLALRKPILTLGEKNSVSEKILSETGSGEIFEYQDIAGMGAFVQKNFEIWKSRGYVLLENADRLEKYTTRYNVARLVDVFNSLCQSTTPAVSGD